MAVKPLSPAEVLNARSLATPEGVIRAINTHLIESFKPGATVTITFDQVERWLRSAGVTINLSSMMRDAAVEQFRNDWVVVERISSINEDSFDPYYIFSPKS